MTSRNKDNILLDYYNRIRQANIEQAKKEILLGALRELFGGDSGAAVIIGGMELGSECRVENIPVHHRRKTGSADTQHRNLIIEFENNMAKTGRHAANQLAEYLAGNWLSGNVYEFTLIATDCLTWVVYAPKPDAVETITTEMHIDASVLMEVDRYVVEPDTLSGFPAFLDRYLFRLQPERATIDSIARLFGAGSPTYYHVVHELKVAIDRAISSTSELQVAFQEWERLLQIAYGSYEGDTGTFAIHTYLSMLAKMLAYEVLTGDSFIDDNEIQSILSGSIFEKYNVADFVERDFFGWINDKPFVSLSISLARQIADSLSDLDFSRVEEDVLKGVYQSLIDVNTRHDLGEYYTPDWLCERITKELDPKPSDTMLDPACGSGSFIRAYIVHLLVKDPSISAESLSDSTYGIDVNPLSVQIAKATKLVAIGSRIQNAKRPIRLNIFLANALYTPKDSLQLFSTVFQVNVNGTKISLDSDMFANLTTYDQLIDICESLAGATASIAPYDLNSFSQRLISALQKRSSQVSSIKISTYHQVYLALRVAKVDKRDSIWKFILQNVYKPLMIKGQFDFVIGNPPWLTYSQIEKGEYQDVALKLAERYHLIPSHKKNMPHLEMAALFVAHTASYFLRDGGQAVMVMPRSIMSADQHDKLREGYVHDLAINGLWDLQAVSNLFPVPSCVLYFTRADGKATRDKGIAMAKDPIPGRIFTGKIPRHNMSYADAKVKLEEAEVQWTIRKMNDKSAWTTEGHRTRNDTNPYRDQFKQGATIVPRSVMFVDLVQGTIDRDDEERLVLVETSAYAKREAKAPWKDITMKGRVPLRQLYRTVLANSIFPFAIACPSLIVLPVRRIRISDELYRLSIIGSNDFLNDGDHESYTWFKKAEDYWEDRRTDKAQGYSLGKWVDYQGKLSLQVISTTDWYVCYNASGTDACAGVFQQGDFDRSIVVDAKAYWARFKSEDEAYYVAGHLNSLSVNQQIKDFQSKGLWGARDIHTTILNIGLERYDPESVRHNAVSQTARECARISSALLESEDLSVMSSHKLGRIRSQIRTRLADQYNKIDSALGWVSK